MDYRNIYWLLLAPFIRHSLRKRYGKKLADLAMGRGREEYRRILCQAQPLGFGNPMAFNAWFAYAFAAAWLGSGKSISPQAMGQVMVDVLKTMRPFFALTDMNRTPKKWYLSMKKYAAWASLHRAKYPSTWDMHFDEGLHRDGSYYYFTSCPICATMNKLGIPEIMPGLCATDQVMFRYQHAVLHRAHTLAQGDDVCDYWIVGDKVKNPQ